MSSRCSRNRPGRRPATAPAAAPPVAGAAWLLGTVLLFEDALHYSTLRTGLAIAPGPIVAAACAVNTGRLIALVGQRTLAIAGVLLFAGVSLS